MILDVFKNVLILLLVISKINIVILNVSKDSIYQLMKIYAKIVMMFARLVLGLNQLNALVAKSLFFLIIIDGR